MSDAKILRWNGRDLPSEFSALPPGEYLVERVDTPANIDLTDDELQGLREGIRALDRGEDMGWEDAERDLRARIAARRRLDRSA